MPGLTGPWNLHADLFACCAQGPQHMSTIAPACIQGCNAAMTAATAPVVSADPNKCLQSRTPCDINAPNPCCDPFFCQLIFGPDVGGVCECHVSVLPWHRMTLQLCHKSFVATKLATSSKQQARRSNHNPLKVATADGRFGLWKPANMLNE